MELVTKKQRSEAARKGWETRKKNEKIRKNELEEFYTTVQKRADKIQRMIDEGENKDQIFGNGHGQEYLTIKKEQKEPGFWERMRIRAKEGRDRRYNWAMKNWTYDVKRIEKDMGPYTWTALLISETMLFMMILWLTYYDLILRGLV